MPLIISCAGVDPRDVDVELEQTAPEVKITSYTGALSDLGSMSTVFDTGLVKIQSNDITDKTGTAMTTGGEIQRNITEIMKSTLNSIGGNVVFIEYDPGFIQNQMVTGYSDFADKLIPDVVITGGITEFDRGLETRGDGVDVGAQATVSGLKSWVPSDEIGVNYGSAGKAGKARITLDFNMKDFTTLAGIAKMTTTNSMVVNKATRQKELGITIFGPTFGLKGSVKKVQGRHEAVRLLVQTSMIQMVGKYLNIPYWRLLGDDTLPDPVVLDSIAAIYYSMAPATRVAAIQQWLYIHGYDTQVTGVLDAQTEAALLAFAPDYQVGSGEISEELFTDIYIGMPFDAAAVGRRAALDNILYQQAMAQAEPAAPEQAAPEAVAYEEQAYEEQVAAAPHAEAAPREAPAAESAGNANALQSTGFGRMLNDSDW
ncbi:MAG: peptidoglycan-binding domain-containing protein [Desulfurivibrionaceae bacterium]